VEDVSRPQNADDAHQNPKPIQHDVGGVAFERGTPGEHDGIRGVEDPNEHERAFRTQPTDEAETENAHQHTDHFDSFYVANDESIHAGIFIERGGRREQIHIRPRPVGSSLGSSWFQRIIELAYKI
jgi:hypothetical protein